ncbi:MAG: nucleotidyl transferase AbiEii/AbiGii toxin family protein [Candidatus Omnitrophica bacterium]|nr:nucleotidyl transferase AbiEii/AbiGii toxin family protein [Candidatus Omnitrophota bacterium]
MISHQTLKNLATQFLLREDIVEKDYVIGWVLWGIGTDPELKSTWIFKGGTCLKKCYIETYRFSEDLDFTILPEGPIKSAQVLPLLTRVLARIREASGLDFSVRTPYLRERPNGLSAEGRLYYRGPRNAPTPASLKLDLTADEKVVRPPVLQPIAHPYPGKLPEPGTVRCYGFEEVFAEKIRALGERGRPRDLYDIINLFWHQDLRAEPALIRSVLLEKCRSKGVPVSAFESIKNSPYRAELEAEWANMLAHQLPVLPPFDQFWRELPKVFSWLEGVTIREKLPLIPALAGVEETAAWVPPPVVWTSGTGIPLEPIRFGAVNHLRVELVYRKEDGKISTPTIEPYSLRRTKSGELLLHALKVPTREPRAYRVDRIQKVTVTTKPFVPMYQIEFPPTGPISAPPATKNL